jgi:hypothetical protein
MQICNNSRTAFTVAVTLEGVKTSAKKIEAGIRLNVHDFISAEQLQANQDKELKITVIHAGKILQKFSHVPESVYISLLDPAKGELTPRVMAYLEGESLARREREIDADLDALMQNPPPCTDQQLAKVSAIMLASSFVNPYVEKNQNMPARDCFSRLMCYHHDALLPYMKVGELWSALKLFLSAIRDGDHEALTDVDKGHASTRLKENMTVFKGEL